MLSFVVLCSSGYGLAVYQIGNSLTYQNGQREVFRDAANANGENHTMGSHIDLGQALVSIRATPDSY